MNDILGSQFSDKLVSKKSFRTLRLLVTNNCSLSCRYCCAEGHQSEYNHFNGDNIKLIVSAVNQLLDVKRIKLTGGEPLNFGGIADVIKSIYEVKREDQIVSIVSNGVNTEQIMELIKYKDLDLTISLPTLRKEIFHQITYNGDKFANVLKTISLLNDNNFNFKINCVLVDDITNTFDNISDLLDKFSKNHNIQLRFLELSINDVNRENLKKIDYKSSSIRFNEIMDNLGYFRSEQCNHRESATYVKDGVIIKYIKYFCVEKCFSCPQNKTSLWISCDGYFTSCSYNTDRAIKIDKFTYDEVFKLLSDNLNKL